MKVDDIVAEALATARVARCCLARTSHLIEAPHIVLQKASGLISSDQVVDPVHNEHFTGILCATLEVIFRQVEVQKGIQIRSFWRLVAGSLLWDFWGNALENRSENITREILRWELQQLEEAFVIDALAPLLSAEHKAQMAAAERQAKLASAELLEEEGHDVPKSASGSSISRLGTKTRQKAKRQRAS